MVAGKALALNTANLGLISATPYGFLSTSQQWSLSIEPGISLEHYGVRLQNQEYVCVYNFVWVAVSYPSN